jgi:hypothetical protein
LNEIRRDLEERKRAIAAEMRRYPQPIAGCDAQYQHLSDQRAAIARQLSDIERACTAGDEPDGALPKTLADLDEGIRRRLVAALAEDPV